MLIPRMLGTIISMRRKRYFVIARLQKADTNLKMLESDYAMSSRYQS